MYEGKHADRQKAGRHAGGRPYAAAPAQPAAPAREIVPRAEARTPQGGTPAQPAAPAHEIVPRAEARTPQSGVPAQPAAPAHKIVRRAEARTPQSGTPAQPAAPAHEIVPRAEARTPQSSTPAQPAAREVVPHAEARTPQGGVPAQPAARSPSAHTAPSAAPHREANAAARRGRARVSARRFAHFVRGYVLCWLAVIALCCTAAYFAAAHYQQSYLRARAAADPDRRMEALMADFAPDRLAGTLAQYGSVPFVADDASAQAAFRAALDGKTLAWQRSAAFRDRLPAYDLLADGTVYAEVTLAADGRDANGFSSWKLRSAALDSRFFPLTALTIRAPAAAQVTVEGVALAAGSGTAEPVHAKLLADAGYTAGADCAYTTYTVQCLTASPAVTVVNGGETLQPESGTAAGTLCYDGLAASDFTASVSARVDAMLDVYMRYMYRQTTLDEILPYTRAGSPAETAFRNVSKDLSWSGSIRSRTVLSSRQYDCVRCGDNAFAVTTATQLHIRASREYDEAFTIDWLFVRGDDGQWMLEDFALLQ